MNTPLETSDSTPLVDFDQLQAACDGDHDLMRELVELYFRQAGEIMAGMDTAIKASSIADVNHLAHKLAGSSLACGMSAVVAPVRCLEHGSKDGHLQDAETYYLQTNNQLAAVRAEVEQYLRRL